MKNANGFGSVYKLSGKRSRPWRAVVTAGFSPEGKQIRKTLGYYPTKKEAMSALGIYNAVPYSLERLRFEDVYRMWSEEHFKDKSPATIRTYENSFAHARALHRKVFSNLRTRDLENCIQAEGVTPSTQHYMKNLFNQMYKYGLRYDFAPRNYALEVHVDAIPETEKRNPFTDEEIEGLWRYIEEDHLEARKECAEMLLVGIYSGWRASELCSFTLEGDLMKGGVKTKSGKDRIVPVHPLIKDIVKEYNMKYNTFQYRFYALRDELGWDHTPHDTRRTFATLASRYGMNENIRKLILGHRNPDLTERVYTTHTVDELRREIAKIGRIYASDLK